jgi:hypothetical protein
MTTWPWWAAGPAIGAFAVLMAKLSGKALGVSSGIGAVCSACAPQIPYFRKKPYTDRWRLAFLAGIPLGGLAAAALSGRIEFAVAMGTFDAEISSRTWVKLAFCLSGGLLAGFGARWADG